MSQPNHHHIVVLQAQLSAASDFDLPGPYTIDSYPTTTPEQVAERIKDATIILASILPLTAEHLSAACSPNLRMIAVQMSGTDHIDLATCRKRGIVVCNASRAVVPAVSEHAIGLYFAARRSFVVSERALRAGQWERGNLARVTLDGDGKMPVTCGDEVMGILGYGPLGQRIEELAEALGMKVMIAERKGADSKRSGRHLFEEVLQRSTVIVLALPKTPESANLISTAELEMMQRHTIIVNVARGGIIDERALLDALRERRIAGAALDVFETEPATPSNSLLLSEEAKDLNLTLTPHLAWAAQTTTKLMQEITKENVDAWCKGQPVNVVA